jgi:hypothetical protein
MEDSSNTRNDDEYHDFSQLFSEPHESTRHHSTKFAIFVTLFCIVVIHYKVPITAWLYSYIFEPTWSILEMLRFYLLPMDEDEYEMDEFGGLHVPTLSNRKLPELQEMATAQPSQQQQTLHPSSFEEEELEPAFLKDQDYPPGWMVYDKEMGVILKTRADKLQQERKRRNECKRAAAVKCAKPPTSVNEQSVQQDMTEQHSNRNTETTLCRTTKFNSPTDSSVSPVVEAA